MTDNIVLAQFQRQRDGRLCDRFPTDGGLLLLLGEKETHDVSEADLQPGSLLLARTVCTLETARLVRITQRLDQALEQALNDDRTWNRLDLDSFGCLMSVTLPGDITVNLTIRGQSEVGVQSLVYHQRTVDRRSVVVRHRALRSFHWKLQPECQLTRVFREYDRRSHAQKTCENTYRDVFLRPPTSLFRLVDETKRRWNPIELTGERIGDLTECSLEQLQRLFQKVGSGDVMVCPRTKAHGHRTLQTMVQKWDRELWNMENPFTPLPLTHPNFWRAACQLSGTRMSVERTRLTGGKIEPRAVYLLCVGCKILHFTFPLKDLERNPDVLYVHDSP